MKKNKKAEAQLVLTITNIFIYALVLLFALMTGYVGYYFFYLNGYTLFFVLYCVMNLLFGKLFDSFNYGDTTNTDLFISESLMLLFSNGVIYVILCLITLKMITPLPLILVQIVQMVLTIIMLIYENKLLNKEFPPLRLLCIYDGEHNDLINRLNNPAVLSLSIVKTIHIKDINYRKIDELLQDIDGIVTLDVHHPAKKKIFKICYTRRMMVYDMPSITDMLIASGEIVHIVDTPIIKINKFGPNQAEKIAKRIIDIFGSLVLLIITSPIMLVTAIAIKLYDGGDIFFKQARLTQNEKEFQIIKFRSMIMNAESKTGAVFASVNDDRITPIGKFIRKCRIDELPQLFNILAGDMSFVGPRPERREIYDQITKQIPEFTYRLCVKAGLTGYAQIYGKYNTVLRDKLLLDLYYIEKYSLIEDIKLIILTLKVVFIPDSSEGVKK